MLSLLLAPTTLVVREGPENEQETPGSSKQVKDPRVEGEERGRETWQRVVQASRLPLDATAAPSGDLRNRALR